MSVIVVSGMIGIGKTSVTELIAKELGTKPFFESVDDNPILPLFYTSTEEEIEMKRYPFLLQLHFLRTRFEAIKQAYKEDNNILDRSIYEDWYFAHVLHTKKGTISDLEMSVYENLLAAMMEEIDGLPYKKAPDLNIYLKASFETVMNRIGLRGREYEQDEGLIEYYRTLWEGYDEWLHKHYKASDVLIVDMDTTDIVNNPEDAKALVEQVKAKLKEVGKL
ncbi:deoxynucleoside kinase [Bacillus thuringiensis]|uniref:deoxynucleoside kinase n=1 Tax=Bacillus cereus group TaxID=86661 RepID=UPI000CD8630F|nr:MULTISPECIES: deoxynucleoside kinase [Bacillus cereus group]MEC3420815.1 deoxynucleoside kinase [Bacillus cereus]MEC3596946.1 deoxynucleoside kinase [Bacillus thuringiensis]MED1574295.1 deoxynucleoside kinase [Bacillus paranthracis]MED1836219.1 deoxynucleoside kinase [Bacillus thuringiensis]MED2670282.1 deoxynucleoside kinase [Bacillus thuringiensis]